MDLPLISIRYVNKFGLLYYFILRQVKISSLERRFCISSFTCKAYDSLILSFGYAHNFQQTCMIKENTLI